MKTMTQMFLKMLKTFWTLINSTSMLISSYFNIAYCFSNVICTTRANTFENNTICTLILYLTLLLKRDCILRVFQIKWNLIVWLVKVCNLLIKCLVNFSILGAKGNLISNNFVLSNNNFDINSSSFSSLNLKKVSLMNLTG